MRRNRLKWLGGILLVLVLIGGFWGVRLLDFTGYFITLAPHSDQNCKSIHGVTGAEDLDIDHKTGLIFLSAYDRRAVDAGEPVNGAIYRLDLTDPGTEPEPVELWRGKGGGDFRPHGISLYRSGNKMRLFVINHPADASQRIELFDVTNGKLKHVETIADPLIASPNDLAAVGMRSFYAGNDVVGLSGWRRMLAMTGPYKNGNLVYYDGAAARIAVPDLAFTNGVALSNDGSQLYLAEMLAKKLHVFGRDAASGNLKLSQSTTLTTFPDNIDVDADGALWIGAHPKFMDVMANSSDPKALAPSQVLRIRVDKDAMKVEEVYLNAGEQISATATAAIHNKRLVLGPIFDNKILVCDRP